MSYSKSHVILIAFAIDTPDSLENVTAKVRFRTPHWHWSASWSIHINLTFFIRLGILLVDRGSAKHLRSHHPGDPRWLQGRSTAGSRQSGYVREQEVGDT